MTLTADAAIPDALLRHLTAFAAGQSPAIAVSYPDQPFAPADGEVYLEATHLPNRPVTRAISSTGAHQHMGFLQVSVMWPGGATELIDATDLGGRIVAHFHKGTRLVSNGVAVRIVRRPWIAPHLTEPGRLRIPVSIPYQCFSA